MPQGVYNSTIRATVGLIQSVGGVADAIVEEGIKAQNLKNETDVRTERRNMREMKAKFDIEKVGTDPSTWEQKWKNTLSNYKGSVKSKNYSPVVNRTVSEGFKEFSVSSSIQLTGDALKANRKEATATIMLDAQDNMDVQNYDGAREDIQRLGDLGLAEDSEVRERITNIGKAEKRDTLDAQLEKDPIKYGEDVKKGTVAGIKLTPADQRRESVRAERETATQENGAIKVVNERVAAGLVPDEETLDEELEGLPISDVRKKIIRKNYGNKKPLSYDERTVLRDEMNDNFKAFQDGKILLDEYTALHTKTSIKMEELGSRPGAGGLRSRLHRVNPDQFDPDQTGNEDAARKRAMEHKDIVSVAEEDVKIRVASITNDILKKRKLTDTEDAGEIASITESLRNDKLYGLQLREALEGEVQTWLEGHTTAQLAELTATDVSKYIDSIQATVTSRVNEERKAPLRDTKAETKTEVQISQEKAVKWRTPVGVEPAVVPDTPVVTPPKAIPVVEDVKPASTSTNVGSDLTTFVKGFEGWNSKAFSDHKQISIGYGTKAKKGEKSITKAEGEKRLAAELGKSRKHVVSFAKKHNMKLNKNQVAALTSFAYNVGSIDQLTAGGTRTNAEIADKILEYKKASGKTLQGLVKRRKAERKLFLS